MTGAGESALIALRGASFGYRQRPVIADVRLEVHPGDMVGIVGPNGAGKTTLLRGMLGLLPPLAGTVFVADVPVGYVPQNEALDRVFPLSVEEVVHMGAYARLRGLRRLAAHERAFALRCLERVEMAERRLEPFQALSGGQRQRVLIARALMMRPRLLFLDEPTRGVDGPTVRAILAVLEELNRVEGLAVLLVSHEIALTRRKTSRVFLVNGGRVRCLAPDELLEVDDLEHVTGLPGEGPR